MASSQPACVINIGPKESRKRLIMGVVVLAVGIGVAIALIFSDLNRWWRIGLFLPFWMGALGLFQAMGKT
ncbi:MAG: hypothetical protein AAB070_00315 [Candidatus Binatota bacterium]